MGQVEPQVLSASTMTGNDVVNLQGEDLGKVEDLVMDLAAGRVSYAVISFGGILGFGNKLFAIPWGLLRLDTDEKVFILDVEREVLKHAPGFTKDEWPDHTTLEWLNNVYAYFDYPVYWD